MTKHIFKITFCISLIFHIFCLILFEKMDFLGVIPLKKEEKIKLSFKRGGDTKAQNGDKSINSSLHTQFSSSINAKSAPTVVKLNENKTQNKPKNSNKIVQDSADVGKINLANIDIYKSSISKPANSAQQAINYIQTQQIPRDQKQDILELYGDTLGDFGTAELDFIINNLRDIGRITQAHINRRGYPKEAILLNQSGRNIVEFYLHPNGDISELSIIEGSRSNILDNDIQTTIKIAYKDYPRPSVKTKIRIYMSYRLGV